MPTELGKAPSDRTSAASGHTLFETARASSVGTAHGHKPMADDHSSHQQSGSPFSNEKKRDDFESSTGSTRVASPVHPTGAHQDAVRMPATASVKASRSASVLHAPPALATPETAMAKAPGPTADTKRLSLFSRVGGMVKGMLRHPNRMAIACIIGGSVCLAVGIASGNPVFTVLGVALIVGGLAKLITSDNTHRAIPPALPPKTPMTSPAEQPPASVAPNVAPTVTPEDDAQQHALEQGFFQQSIEQEQRADSPTRRWAEQQRTLSSDDKAFVHDLDNRLRQVQLQQQGRDVHNAGSVSVSRLSEAALHRHTQLTSRDEQHLSPIEQLLEGPSMRHPSEREVRSAKSAAVTELQEEALNALRANGRELRNVQSDAGQPQPAAKVDLHDDVSTLLLGEKATLPPRPQDSASISDEETRRLSQQLEDFVAKR